MNKDLIFIVNANYNNDSFSDFAEYINSFMNNKKFLNLFKKDFNWANYKIYNEDAVQFDDNDWNYIEFYKEKNRQINLIRSKELEINGDPFPYALIDVFYSGYDRNNQEFPKNSQFYHKINFELIKKACNKYESVLCASNITNNEKINREKILEFAKYYTRKNNKIIDVETETEVNTNSDQYIHLIPFFFVVKLKNLGIYIIYIENNKVYTSNSYTDIEGEFDTCYVEQINEYEKTIKDSIFWPEFTGIVEKIGKNNLYVKSDSEYFEINLISNISKLKGKYNNLDISELSVNISTNMKYLELEKCKYRFYTNDIQNGYIKFTFDLGLFFRCALKEDFQFKYSIFKI